MAESKEIQQTKSAIELLKNDEYREFTDILSRISFLQNSRKNHFGVDIDNLWADADRDYAPHRLHTAGKRILETDETKGWRSTRFTSLGSKEWQSDISQANPYVKIQTALAILVDQNPSGVFTATSKKYTAATELMRQLYRRSWEVAKSKQQLKLFVFNQAKYGWAIARTYPLKLIQDGSVIVKYDEEHPEQSEYKKQRVVVYNDVMRENLDPRNTWIDDLARPFAFRPMRDWCFRKIYDMDVFKEEFGRYKNTKYVTPGGNLDETIGPTGNSMNTEQRDSKNLVEVLFYENLVKDRIAVIANGIPVVFEPLPVSDERGVKRLSCWQAPWTLRHAQSAYGIGIYEAIRYDQAFLDRVRNMTIDQLTLSIYKMFFYQGTSTLTDTGDIVIAPGVGKQVLDPKSISWLDIPGPGREAFEGIAALRKDLDEVSGITDPLLGNITGKTAFEIAQAKESSLKRLKNPLDNLLDALNEDAYTTVSLIQMLYSLPEILPISSPELVDAYLKEIESDPDLYERDEEGAFSAKVFREFPLNLSEQAGGQLVESPETRFFRVKPKLLRWDGVIQMEAQSILTPSKQVDKALELEMWNVIIPLLAQPPELYKRTVESIVKLYDKNPEDVLPDTWLQAPAPPPQAQALGAVPEQPQEEPLFVGGEGAPQGPPPPEIPQSGTPAVATNNPSSITGKIASRIAAPFRGV